MWWQILPSLGVVTAVSCLPFFTLPAIKYIHTGRPSMRELKEGSRLDLFLREGFLKDVELVGDNWTSSGLDAIPDD